MKNGNNDDFWPQAKHQATDFAKAIYKEIRQLPLVAVHHVEVVRVKSLPQDDSPGMTVGYAPECDIVFSLTKSESDQEFVIESTVKGFQLQMLKSREEVKDRNIVVDRLEENDDEQP